MLHRSVTPPCPRGIANIAFAKWKKLSKHQYFYGNFYTCPTSHIYIQQQFGLAISTAIAMHIRNAKKGTRTSVEDEEAAIAAVATHADTPPRTVTPISPQLDRFDDTAFTWAGILGADATFPANVWVFCKCFVGDRVYHTICIFIDVDVAHAGHRITSFHMSRHECWIVTH